ncbi:hypothetical protein EOA27_35045, partial [Mesorhizobium sp. M2A.F.Ca.ET.037.01.1.1]
MSIRLTYAPLCPVVTEAGGVITDWEGQPLSLTSSGAIAASGSPE